MNYIYKRKEYKTVDIDPAEFEWEGTYFAVLHDKTIEGFDNFTVYDKPARKLLKNSNLATIAQYDIVEYRLDHHEPFTDEDIGRLEELADMTDIYKADNNYLVKFQGKDPSFFYKLAVADTRNLDNVNKVIKIFEDADYSVNTIGSTGLKYNNVVRIQDDVKGPQVYQSFYVNSPNLEDIGFQVNFWFDYVGQVMLTGSLSMYVGLDKVHIDNPAFGVDTTAEEVARVLLDRMIELDNI